jgi:hypothetical protein
VLENLQKNAWNKHFQNTKSQVSVANSEKSKMENVFSTRVCDLRIFERQGNGPPTAFEERKTDEGIESNSTFQLPSGVSPLTGVASARSMEQ